MGVQETLSFVKILKMHVAEHILDDKQMIDQEKIDLVARMGGDWYCRTDKISMFEIKKPITTRGLDLTKCLKKFWIALF